MKAKPTMKFKLFLTVGTVVATLAIAVSAAFAWFSTNATGNVGNVDLAVVGSTNVSLTATITDGSGAATGSFRFTDAVPGSRFTVTAKMTNNTDKERTVALVISDLLETVRPYRTDGETTAIDRNRKYQTITMRNAFAVVKTEGTQYFAELQEVTRSGEDGTALVLYDEITVSAKDPAIGNSGTAEIRFVIQFMNEVKGKEGADAPLTAILSDVLVDNDGLNPSDPIAVNINAYQGQYFKIGMMELIEKIA